MSKKSPELNAPAGSVPVPSSSLDDGLVRLRPWRLNDVRCIEGATGDARMSAGTTLPTEFTIADGEAFIRRQWTRVPNGEGLSLAIACADSDEAVGSVVSMLRPQPGVTGLGYWIVPDARRRGFASGAVALLAEWSVSVGGFGRMEAWIKPDNEASQRVVAGAGFEMEGVLRSFLPLGDERQDMQVWSRVRAGA
jgi:ribosomal-protein-alanine N-acetyltransferase